MQATPQRLLTTVFWPVAIWPSIFNLEKHPADNYAERTFPLIATAIGFWVCVGLLGYLLLQTGSLVSIDDGDGMAIQARMIPRWIEGVSGVMWFFLPSLYVIGLWLYAARDEAFPSWRNEVSGVNELIWQRTWRQESSREPCQLQCRARGERRSWRGSRRVFVRVSLIRWCRSGVVGVRRAGAVFDLEL